MQTKYTSYPFKKRYSTINSFVRAQTGWIPLLLRVTLTISVTLVVIGTSHAQQKPSDGRLLGEGLVAYVAADFRVAYEILMPLANKGNPIAQLFIGRLFDKGDGVPKDFEAAYRWVSQAAFNGSSEAAYELGTWSEFGSCRGKHPAEALTWYKLAEKNGDSRAANKIGELYLLDTDRAAESLFWFKRGAMAYDIDAFYNLGKLYAEGRAVPKDLIASYSWFYLAALIDSPLGLTKGMIARDELREFLMPPQVAKGRRYAEELFASLIKYRPSLGEIDDANTFARED